MRVEDIVFDNTLLDEKSYKTFMGEKPLGIWFDKVDAIRFKFVMELDIKNYLVLECIMQFIIGLITL